MCQPASLRQLCRQEHGFSPAADGGPLRLTDALALCMMQAQAPHGWYDENGRTPSWDLGSVAFLLVAGAWSLCSYCFE